MKKILLLSVMSLLAFSMTACKGDKYEPKDDQEQTKDDGIYVSEEDANWIYKLSPMPISFPNYVTGYCSAEKIDVSCSIIPPGNPNGEDYYCNLPPPREDWEWSKIENEATNFRIWIEPEGLSCGYTYTVSNTMIPHNIDRFNELAKKNNDISYNGRYWTSGEFIPEKTKYINIVCAEDYDEQHPQGSLLNDIVEIRYFTARPFLNSKYKNKRIGDLFESVTYESLADFNKKEIDLLTGVALKLTKAPLKQGLYTFTISYCSAVADEVSVTTFPINIKGE